MHKKSSLIGRTEIQVQARTCPIELMAMKETRSTRNTDLEKGSVSNEDLFAGTPLLGALRLSVVEVRFVTGTRTNMH